MQPRVLLFGLDEWPFSDRLAALLAKLGVDEPALRLVYYAYAMEAPDVDFDDLPERNTRPALEPALMGACRAIGNLGRKVLGASPVKRGRHVEIPGVCFGFHWSANRPELEQRFVAAGFKIASPKDVAGLPPLDWWERLASTEDRQLADALRALREVDGDDTDLGALLLAGAHAGGNDARVRRRLFERLRGLESIHAHDLDGFSDYAPAPVMGAVEDLTEKEIAEARRRSAARPKRPTKPAKIPAPRGPSVAAKDVVFTIDPEDPAYLAIVDLETYDRALPRWSFDSITRKVASEMSAGHIVAFGTPDQPVRVRLSAKQFRGRADATATAMLDVTGALCLVTYTSLTMAADGDPFPEPHDPFFRLPKGKYRVDVHRMFAHRAGAQFAEAKLPRGDHYVLSFSPLVRAPKKHAWVPWALPPRR